MQVTLLTLLRQHAATLGMPECFVLFQCCVALFVVLHSFAWTEMHALKCMGYEEKGVQLCWPYVWDLRPAPDLRLEGINRDKCCWAASLGLRAASLYVLLCY